MSTRRDFIKQLGLLSAAVTIPTLGNAAGLGLGDQTDKPDDHPANSLADNGPMSSWDVIVVGGGPGGCTAAISAAREGAKVLLIEDSGQLGGLGTIGMVPAWCPFTDGEKVIYRGLAQRIFREAKKGVPFVDRFTWDWVPINPEWLMYVYDRMVTDAKVQVLFFSRVCDVKKSADDTIEAVVVANQRGLSTLKAKVFIDATGNGSLSMWAGAKFKLGYDDAGHQQASTLCFEMAGINVADYNNGAGLWGGPDTVIGQIVKTGKYPLIDGHFCNNLVGGDVMGCNAGHLHVQDTTDPWQVSEAMLKGRQVAWQHAAALKEAKPSTFGNAILSRTATVLGIRESRRVEGDYTLTLADWEARRSFDDGIGRNCYYIDIHGKEGSHKEYGRGESHGIPYRCLTPKGLKNLLTAGRDISVDADVFGSTRIMPCCLVVGEAAGMAAQHAITETGGDVHAIDIQHLRKRLLDVGAWL